MNGMLSVYSFRVRYKFHGLSANASLAPWDGRNALDAAVQCYSSIAAMRKHLRPSIKVHGKNKT